MADVEDIPVWFLDVDGVVSPFGVGDQWDEAHLYPGQSSDLTVPYRRHVVDTITRLHTTGVVEVRWLTTWDADLLTAWHDVGLGPFEVATPAKGRRRWWKADTVARFLSDHPHRRAVWTDDDLTPARLRGFDRNRLYAFAPSRSVGLTDEQLARIEDWAQAKHA